jgi:hypothetical protein
MSSGIRCVVNVAGGSTSLVGEIGKIVSPHNHQALAEAIMVLLEMGKRDRRRFGLSARQKIVD